MFSTGVLAELVGVVVLDDSSTVVVLVDAMLAMLTMLPVGGVGIAVAR